MALCDLKRQEWARAVETTSEILQRNSKNTKASWLAMLMRRHWWSERPTTAWMGLLTVGFGGDDKMIRFYDQWLLNYVRDNFNMILTYAQQYLQPSMMWMMIMLPIDDRDHSCVIYGEAASFDHATCVWLMLGEHN